MAHTTKLYPVRKDFDAVSEYQYYEFQAIDRPLDEADKEALGRLSSRATITSTTFQTSTTGAISVAIPAR